MSEQWPFHSLLGGHGFSIGRQHRLACGAVVILEVIDALLPRLLIRGRNDLRKDGLVGVGQGVIGRAATIRFIIFPLIIVLEVRPAKPSKLGAPRCGACPL